MFVLDYQLDEILKEELENRFKRDENTYEYYEKLYFKAKENLEIFRDNDIIF